MVSITNMGIDSIVNTESIEEYLKECGFDVVERDDEYVEFSSGAKTLDGEFIYLVVEPDNVSEMIGDTLRANNSVDDVFEEYVEERNIFDDNAVPRGSGFDQPAVV